MIGVLPGEDPAAANEFVTHVVATGAGGARNLAVVASAEATIAIGGEWGTLTEIAFARRAGRRVILLEELSGGERRRRDAGRSRDRGRFRRGRCGRSSPGVDPR